MSNAVKMLYNCPRCNGTGHLPQFDNVLGGLCFGCAGRGKKLGRPTAPGINWAVSAVSRETGERGVVCHIIAKTEVAALAKAKAQLARGNGFIPDTAQVAV